MEKRSSPGKQATSLVLRQAATPADLAEVKKCFQAYTEWLNEDITFQNYAAEFEGLPGKYAPPSGALLLALDKTTDQVLGCIALRPIQLEEQYLSQRRPETRYCEIKRLFVYPEARGRQVSRTLVREVLRIAEEEGYHEVLLDTLAKMQPAVKLYKSEGFEETEPYTVNPLAGVIYFSRKLN